MSHVPLFGSWRSRASLVRLIFCADEVLIGGGGLLADRVARFYRPFYRTARLAHLLRTPYRLVAVGVSTVRRSGSDADYRWMFDHAVSASVRDVESRDRVLATGARRSPAVQDDPALWRTVPVPGNATAYDLVVNLRPWESGDTQEERPIWSTFQIVEAVAAAINTAYRASSRVAWCPCRHLSMTTTKRLSRSCGGD